MDLFGTRRRRRIYELVGAIVGAQGSEWLHVTIANDPVIGGAPTWAMRTATDRTVEHLIFALTREETSAQSVLPPDFIWAPAKELATIFVGRGGKVRYGKAYSQILRAMLRGAVVVEELAPDRPTLWDSLHKTFVVKSA